MLSLTEAAEERGHGLVLGHVDEPPPQTEVREDEQHLLHDVVDAGHILIAETNTQQDTD